MADVKAKLAELGWTLPQPSKPVACYVPVVQTGNLLVVSGQLPMVDGKVTATGAVPSVVSVEDARQASDPMHPESNLELGKKPWFDQNVEIFFY